MGADRHTLVLDFKTRAMYDMHHIGGTLVAVQIIISHSALTLFRARMARILLAAYSSFTQMTCYRSTQHST